MAADHSGASTAGHRFGDVARVLDLTWPVEAGIPVPPGFPAVTLDRFLSRDDGDVATVEILRTSLHAGTHMDAAAHMLDDGTTVDQIDPLSLCGPAVLVDVPGLGPWEPVEAAHLEAWERACGERIERGDAVLLHTGHGRLWGDPDAYLGHGWPHVGSSAIDLLLERGARALGVECADPDRVDQHDLASASFECHRRLLGAGVHILENLAHLEEVPPGRLEILALPLAVRGGSGAPIRILALLPA